MSKDEFVKLHGIESWIKLVQWRQEMYKETANNCITCYTAQCNANIIVDNDIIKSVLNLLGLKSTNILEAKEELKNQTQTGVPLTWRDPHDL